jgi:uncharacterized protein (UPF0332 family)
MSGSVIQLKLLEAKAALEAARVLAAQGDSRNSIPCAYFAVFRAATAMGAAASERHSDCLSCQETVDQPFLAADPVNRAFYDDLLKAYELRRTADCEAAQGTPAESTEGTLRSAAEFLALAEKFLEGTGCPIE